MSAPNRSVIVGPAAAEVVRNVGPTAWVVLQTMLTTATVDGRTVVASVRTLAPQLGLAKDTVARALLVLRRQGLVEPRARRRGTGQFASGTYRVNIAPDALRVIEIKTAPPTSTPFRALSRSDRSSAQLFVLDS